MLVASASVSYLHVSSAGELHRKFMGPISGKHRMCVSVNQAGENATAVAVHFLNVGIHIRL